MEREKAFELLLKYNKEKYHIQHAVTVEEVMKWFARELGYDTDLWGVVGLLHDIDFEIYPQEHCVKAVEILRSENCHTDIIHAVCSHGYRVVSDVKPVHEMEKILYATDELTGIIFAAAKMRPSKSISDMELSSLKKKFKDKAFAAGCSREIISNGAEMLGWDLDKLLSMTLEAMRSSENTVSCQISQL